MNYYNYFTEIEEHFVKRRGKHLWVSPLDWSLITTWRGAGVPLHVALRGIDKAMDSFFTKQARPANRVSTLFYCHGSVMEEFAQYVEAHQGDGSAGQSAEPRESKETEDHAGVKGPNREAILSFLKKNIFEIRAAAAKHCVVESTRAGIDRVLTRLEEIAKDLESETVIDAEGLQRDLTILDDLLVTELRLVLPSETMALWEKDAKSELKIYKKKLSKDMYQKILDNYLRNRIHEYYGLGELSLFHLG